MAIPFLNNINLSDNQLQNAKLHITSTAPTAAAAQIYFDSTADLVANPPTYDLTAKYYSNTTDLWVSLKEYSFPTGNYVTGAVTGTTPKPIITFDLNATDGDAAETSEGNGIRYLSKNNKWALVSEIPGTYAWTISDNAVSAVTAGVASGDTLQIAASSDLTSALTLAGEADITKVLTVGLKVDGGVGVENNYIVNQVSATAAADDTIPFSDYKANVDPLLDTYVVKKTTFGTIPIDALTEVKQYIDDSVAGGLIYQGGFDGSTGFVTGTSNYLDNRGTQIAVNKGWTYTVTTAGTFYGEVVEVGDVLIAEDDLASGTGALTDWTTVQNNIDLASLTQIGIGNVNAGTGIDVVYSGGTATVSLADAAARSGSIAIPTSDTYTYPNSITAGATNDVLIQLVDSGTGETVYADVT
ncbi:MAG: hypothetical protein K0U52_03145, partial [Gammaproteobacteria bacterium]|nr:hypothetical protein [Gammaproteobacteria bacterium]